MTKMSWGNFPKTTQQNYFLSWRDQPLPTVSSQLPYGLGRSYGDSCLNDQGTLLITQNLNHLLSFDATTGILLAESGVTLEDLLLEFVPHGWFLPVTPGTKYVTLGGAVANDVHGKNHHCVGTFGHHILELTLKRSNQEILLCSPSQNADLFYASIGGLGLTGLILTVKLQLKKNSSSTIQQDILIFRSLEEFYQLSSASKKNYEFNVAWVDCFASSSNEIRGVFFRGNFSHDDQFPVHKKPGVLRVPFFLPNNTLNFFTVQSFNEFYFQAHRLKAGVNLTTTYDSFFYPLDSIYQWNRIYGSNGFYQYQCVIPLSERESMKEIFSTIRHFQQGSFLAVLKIFGDKISLGPLSFPMEGVTLALDFPVNEKSTKLLEKLDDIVVQAKGRVYIAKDARMSKRAFHAYYPQFNDFLKFKDPCFTSSFLRRIL